jgi:hypothetical protein
MHLALQEDHLCRDSDIHDLNYCLCGGVAAVYTDFDAVMRDTPENLEMRLSKGLPLKP